MSGRREQIKAKNTDFYSFPLDLCVTPDDVDWLIAEVERYREALAQVAHRPACEGVGAVGYERFPRQGKTGKTVFVCFDYDTSRQLRGTIVRNDLEAPGKMIIQLEDGRFVLSTECQYRLP